MLTFLFNVLHAHNNPDVIARGVVMDGSDPSDGELLDKIFLPHKPLSPSFHNNH